MEKLYIHVGQAKHFLTWELPEFKKYFKIVDTPNEDALLLAFGPDVLEEASKLPAKARFAVLFPGFNCNPLRNEKLRNQQLRIISQSFKRIFINRGPLQHAYKSLDNVTIYPFSVDIKKVAFKRYRSRIKSIIHVSSNSPQKDWERSEEVMKRVGLPYEVFPPRDSATMQRYIEKDSRRSFKDRILGSLRKEELPYGYLRHTTTIKKYQSYDAFLHIASDIKHEKYLDGMYTASLIEAGLTGSIIFWHDTYGIGGYLDSVFEVSADPEKAAVEIKEIIDTVNIRKWSKKTRKEMKRNFNPENSVRIRAEEMLRLV